MEIFLGILIFMMGSVFGSFFTLAVYRIPIGEDITHKHSFCPNCEHKLGLLDLFPVFSYLLLGGKCRYCKKPIKIRYFLLEALSGIVFLVFAISLNMNIYSLEIDKLVYFVFGILYFCALFIIAGIDKEKIMIQKSVLLYAILVVVTYIAYLYFLGMINIYRYCIYLIAILLLVIIDTILLRKKAKDNYPIEVVMLGVIMALFTGESVFILTVIFTLLSMAITLLLKKIVRRKKKEEKRQVNQNMPIGYYLCITNTLLLLFVGFVANYLK